MKQVLLVITLFALACNNTPEEKKAPDPATPVAGGAPEQTPPPSPDGTACYSGQSGRDTVTLSVTTSNGQVTGTLDYDFFEKDKSHGSVSGLMHGDTLIADYIYTSEGMQSIRPVAFLKKGTTLSEGYGPAVKRDGKMVFSNPATLKFGQGFVLEQAGCK